MNKWEPVLQPVDLIVAAGAVATVLGALLIVLSTTGSFNPAVPSDAVNLDANQWVQPALGQTLVEVAVLERKRSEETDKAANKLNQTARTARALSRTSTRIKNLTKQVEQVRVDKTARVEFVKGRTVVNFTSRGIKNHVLPDQAAFNHRMIHSAENAGNRIEKEFQGKEQSNLGEAIVVETQSQIEATGRTQEQVGAAIVKATLVRNHYEDAMARAQERLGFLVSGMARTEI
jgi:ribosomal protein S15P/S13E